MKFSIITLFPEMFAAIKQEGVIARAIKNGLIDLETVYLRNFADNARKNVDDHPYGGSDGMVIRPDITEKAIESVRTENTFIVHLTPAGQVFKQSIAQDLASKKHILLLCGRYAGYDCRVIEKYVHLNLSIGDFILSGGEIPAMCLLDAVTRHIPKVLGNEKSVLHDSFTDGLLEAPLYTQPREFHDKKVPDILLSGDHKKIHDYQRKEQLRITAQNRPDLIQLIWSQLNEKEKEFCKNVQKGDC